MQPQSVSLDKVLWLDVPHERSAVEMPDARTSSSVRIILPAAAKVVTSSGASDSIL